MNTTDSKQPEPSNESEREAGFAGAQCWTADQQLEILCETLRNITSGTTKLHEENYDQAALYLEIAAEKLRLLERCRQSNDQALRSAPTADVERRKDNGT